jgi:hypothetical protein
MNVRDYTTLENQFYANTDHSMSVFHFQEYKQWRIVVVDDYELVSVNYLMAYEWNDKLQDWLVLNVNDQLSNE